MNYVEVKAFKKRKFSRKLPNVEIKINNIRCPC